MDSCKTKSTLKHHRKNYFVVVDKEMINDTRLSWKAKGLMLYLLGQSDGWQFYESEITTHSKDGRDSTSNGLNELEEYGYLRRTPIRNEKGQFIGKRWDIYETPITNQ
jgi:hypothetical protein